MFNVFIDFFATVASQCGTNALFGLPHWFEYLDVQFVNGKCQIQNFAFPDSLLPVGLAVVDILLHIAGFVAVGFVMYGGVQYLISRGEPDKAKRALSTIIDALVGLAIAIIAAATISFIGHAVGGAAT